MPTKPDSHLPQDDKEPSAAFLTKVDEAKPDLVMKLLGIPAGLTKEEKLAKLTTSQKVQLQEIEEEAIANFGGQLDELESALGMLRMGHHFGWKVLYLIHSKKTIRKYEDMLGIKIREVFPETGPSSYRSVGLNLAQRFSNFWKVVGGDTKIPRKKDIF